MKTGIARSLIGVMVFALAVLGIGLAPNSWAAELDLTASGSSGEINDAWFFQATVAPAGTGNLDSFVRVSTNDLVEEGYNTSGRPTAFDENSSPQFTHDLLYSDLVEVSFVPDGGVLTDYYEFILDINQTNADSLLSLDKLVIWQTDTASFTGTDFTTLTDELKVYDLGANSVLLDYSLESGSGQGDMYLYIPKEDFDPTLDYVYLYSMFGATGDYGNNDGFEEWALRTEGPTDTPVPEPGTMMLLGSGLVGLAGWGRKKFRK